MNDHTIIPGKGCSCYGATPPATPILFGMTELNYLYWLRGYLEAKRILEVSDIKKMLEHANIAIGWGDTLISWIKGHLEGLLSNEAWQIAGYLPVEVNDEISAKIAQRIPEIEKSQYPLWTTTIYPTQPWVSPPKYDDTIQYHRDVQFTVEASC